MFVATSTATPCGSLPTGIVAVTQLHPRARDEPVKGAFARGMIVTARSAITESTAVAEDLFKAAFIMNQTPN
jgi:hypothetical protein